MKMLQGMQRNGSSPRGRGTRDPGRRVERQHRFIPARAGNTPTSLQPSGHQTVHPRAGGEHLTPGNVVDYEFGSSPRGRGTRAQGEIHRQGQRFIPARAGNTPRRAQCHAPRPVHPRAGGEHLASAHPDHHGAGSSPRGRGTRMRLDVGHARLRFIPARAGNTRGCHLMSGRTTVHPRAGGEHAGGAKHALVSAGSSPRGRGTRARTPPGEIGRASCRERV